MFHFGSSRWGDSSDESSAKKRKEDSSLDDSSAMAAKAKKRKEVPWLPKKKKQPPGKRGPPAAKRRKDDGLIPQPRGRPPCVFGSPKCRLAMPVLRDGILAPSVLRNGSRTSSAWRTS